MQTTNVTPPETGTLVFSSDGEEIGEITQSTPEYVQVKKGMIVRKAVYIPVSAIVGTALGGDGVQISLTKEQVESGDYAEPPSDDAGASGEVRAEEHNTMGASTPYGTTGETADLAASRPGTPPQGSENTFDQTQPEAGLRDDTDVSQKSETERHYTEDRTARP